MDTAPPALPFHWRAVEYHIRGYVMDTAPKVRSKIRDAQDHLRHVDEAIQSAAEMALRLNLYDVNRELDVATGALGKCEIRIASLLYKFTGEH